MMPSACSFLISYDNSIQRINIYSIPEQVYDLVLYLSGEKDKNDSSVTMHTYQAIDKKNQKCGVILKVSKKGIEGVSVSYGNDIYSYVTLPLE